MFVLALVFCVALSALAANGQVKGRDYLNQKYNLSPHQKKISSVVRATIANARPHAAMSYLQSGDRVHVLVEVAELDADLLEALAASGRVEIANEKYGLIQCWLDLDKVEDIAAYAAVRKIKPVLRGFTRAGSVVSQGDRLLNADDVREVLGVDGSGIKIGVISDGVDNLRAARLSGDLPSGVEILDNTAWGDEGTAMLEIIHDLAPGASLAFSQGWGSRLEFVRSIEQLVEAGANIIVDDIGFFESPFFEDGLIALEAESAIEEGVVFVSAAGNSALEHYEGPFVPIKATIPELLEQGIDEDIVHDFGGGDFTQRIIVEPGWDVSVFLQWNEATGAAGDDYDLLVFGADGDCEARRECEIYWGFDNQDGNDDPFESAFIANLTNRDLYFDVVVLRFSGTEERVIEMYYSGALIEEYNIPAGSVWGQPAARRVIAVGAINASDPGSDDIADYSSHGPAAIYLPSFESRTKPDISAIDAVRITGVGGFGSPFFGTSAAAPHVAAIVALVLQQNPFLRPQQVRQILEDTAVELGAANIYGAGRIDALAAVSGVEEVDDFTYELPAGWSMVSVPVEGVDMELNSLFPDAISAFAFADGYQSVAELVPCQGYWLHLENGGNYGVSGTEVDQCNPVLPAGWSMIGAPFGGTARAQIGQDPAAILVSVFGFASGYQSVQQMAAGEGYWVSLNAAGRLGLGAAAAPRIAPPAPNRAALADGFLWAVSRGRRQEVYLGTDPDAVVALPPLPPAAVLDLRVEVQGVGVGQVPIGAEAAAYPVQLQGGEVELGWEMNPAAAGSWELLVDGHSHILQGRGSLQVEASAAQIQVRSGRARAVPAAYFLAQNFPNPFNPTTTIHYALKEGGRVELGIYNVMGQQVRELVRQVQPAGTYSAVWDGRDHHGQQLANGVYFCQLRAGAFRSMRRMILMK